MESFQIMYKYQFKKFTLMTGFVVQGHIVFFFFKQVSYAHQSSIYLIKYRGKM